MSSLNVVVLPNPCFSMDTGLNLKRESVEKQWGKAYVYIVMGRAIPEETFVVFMKVP